ncbi:group III truncated hemoglobin [bacterium]|nr:MAG: group III truncated hemoglobin [bacterium]
MHEFNKSDILTEEDCKRLVYTFYDSLQKNERLGYIFNQKANIEWDLHLPKMVDFWSNILFQTGRYKGNPYQAHLHLTIQESDFEEWITIFKTTVDSNFAGSNAERAKGIADNVAAMFISRMKMDGHLPF